MSILNRFPGKREVPRRHRVRSTLQRFGRLLILSIGLPALLFLLAPTAAQPVAAQEALAPTSLPTVWFQLAPSGGLPPARAPFSFMHAGGYDQKNDRMMVFGGITPNTTNNLNDTWVLIGADGTAAAPSWVQLATVNTPAARRGHAGDYDAVHNRLIIYGGCLGFCLPLDNNVYVLTNANGLGGTPTWTQLSPTGGPPPARDGATAVYDPTSNSLIVFGGDNCCGGRFNDTWVLTHANGLGGTPAWTQLSPGGGPPAAREGHSAVYDSVNNRMIVFGGDDGHGGLFNDTWVLSNANGVGGGSTWTQLAPTGSLPPGRYYHGVVYNAAANQMEVVGGDNATGFFTDTWKLTGANGLGGTPAWQQVVPVSTTPPQTGYTAYRATTKRVVNFEGSPADTWVLLFAQ